jgi:hypothetical protein
VKSDEVNDECETFWQQKRFFNVRHPNNYMIYKLAAEFDVGAIAKCFIARSSSCRWIIEPE